MEIIQKITTKFKIMRIFLLIITLITFSSYSQTKLHTGDLLFININCGPMCEAINAVTEGYKGKDFNHMGLVVEENNTYFVFEAIGEAVVKTPLKTYLNYTKEEVYIGRLKKKYTSLIPYAIAFCQNQLGVPYDQDFLYDNGKYYCSELIYDAFKFANNNEPFFKLYPMTYKEPNSSTFFPIWVEHFNKIGIPIPEGEPGCNPGGMSLDKKITIKPFKI